MRLWRSLLLSGVAFLLAVAIFVYLFAIIITIENVGSEPIRNVTVEMSQTVYNFGDISPSETETEITFPTGDSEVRLLWIANDSVHSDWIGGYVSFLSRGAIDVRMPPCARDQS